MRHHKIIYASSYDRGLQHLLKLWPKVKQAVPDATLDIFYGWDLYDKGFANNPERMAWKQKINEQMQQDGITHHGRVGKDELRKWRKKCGIWAYPTHFDEINCITALEMQRDGAVPVVINQAALAETVQSGVKVTGDIYDPDVADKYLSELVALMQDESRWKQEQVKGVKFAKAYDWADLAKAWVPYFA